MQQLWFFSLSKLIKNGKEYYNVKLQLLPRRMSLEIFILFKLCIYVFTLIDSFANNHQLNNFPRSNFFFLAMIRHIQEGIILFKRNWGIERNSLGQGREERRGVKGKNDLILHLRDFIPSVFIFVLIKFSQVNILFELPNRGSEEFTYYYYVFSQV